VNLVVDGVHFLACKAEAGRGTRVEVFEEFEVEFGREGVESKIDFGSGVWKMS
jgi:hypothetical protein